MKITVTTADLIKETTYCPVNYMKMNVINEITRGSFDRAKKKIPQLSVSLY